MVAVYAPTEDRDEEDKDKVYDDLVGACSRISRHDLILILKTTMPRSGKNPLLTKWRAGIHYMISPVEMG